MQQNYYGQYGRGQQQPNMMMGGQQNMYGQQQPNMMMGQQQQPNMMMGQQQQPNMMMGGYGQQNNMMMGNQQPQNNMMMMGRGGGGMQNQFGNQQQTMMGSQQPNQMMGQQQPMMGGMMMNQQQQQQPNQMMGQQQPNQMMNMMGQKQPNQMMGQKQQPMMGQQQQQQQPQNNMMMGGQQQQQPSMMMGQQPQQPSMMMGGGQQQPQQPKPFEEPQELKLFNLGQKWARTSDYDAQTGVLSIGETRGTLFYDFRSGNEIPTSIPDEIPQGETRMKFIGNNNYVIVSKEISDKVVIANLGQGGGKRQVSLKTVEHKVPNRLSYWFIELLSDGKHVAVSYDSSIVIIDPNTASLVTTLQTHGRVKSMCALPNGRLATGVMRQYTGQNEGGYLETDSEVHIWEISQGTKKLLQPSLDTRNRCNVEGVRGLGYSKQKDSVIAAVGGYNQVPKIWIYDLKTLQKTNEMDFKFPLRFSDDQKMKTTIMSLGVMGRYVIAGCQGCFKVFSLDTFEFVKELPGVCRRDSFPYHFSANFDINMFFTASNQSVKCWEIPQSWLDGYDVTTSHQPFQLKQVQYDPQKKQRLYTPPSQSQQVVRQQHQQEYQQRQQQPPKPQPRRPQRPQQKVIVEEEEEEDVGGGGGGVAVSGPKKLYAVGTDGNLYVMGSRKMDKCCAVPKNTTHMTIVGEDNLFVVAGEKLWKFEGRKFKKIVSNSSIKKCFSLVSCKGKLFSLYNDGGWKSIKLSNAFQNMVAGCSQRTTLKKMDVVRTGAHIMFALDGNTLYEIDEKGMARRQMGQVKVWGTGRRYMAGGHDPSNKVLCYISDKGKLCKKMGGSKKEVPRITLKRPQGICVVDGTCYYIENGELFGINVASWTGKPKKYFKVPGFRFFGY